MSKRGKAKTQTTPQGAEIPVPKRGDFLRDLAKVSTPKPEGQPESKSGK